MHRSRSFGFTAVCCIALAVAPFVGACATQHELPSGLIETRVWPRWYPRALAWPHRAGHLNLDPLGLLPGLRRAGEQIGRGVGSFAQAAALIALGVGLVAIGIFFGGCGRVGNVTYSSGACD